MTRRSSKDKLTGKAKEAMGKASGDRHEEAEGTAKRAEEEIKKRMCGIQDRPLPQEPPDQPGRADFAPSPGGGSAIPKSHSRTCVRSPVRSGSLPCPANLACNGS